MSINIGIIGTGNIAVNALVPALVAVPGAQLWSVLSRDQARASKFAQTFHAAAPQAAADNLEDFLADPELDAVIIASPDKLHAEQTIAAAQAGKHVLVEKPMATSVADAQAMVAACTENKVKLAVAYHLHWHLGHRQVYDLIQAGSIGTLRHCRAHWTFPAADASNWRASSDVGQWWSLAGVGTHSLDFIRWMLVPSCGEVVSISSTISREVWHGPHDETAILSMRFASGATAELCSSVLFQAPSRAEIYGSKGYFRCENTLSRFGAGGIETQQGKLDFPVADPYIGEIADFVDAINEDREPEVNGAEGLRNVELLVQATTDMT